MKAKVKPNWADPTTTAENEVLPKWMKWAWSGRTLSYSLNFLLMAQITFYCTDILAMPAGIVGTLLLASKIFDGITDIFAGYIIDRTHTRWGKARPFDIFLALAWICTILLFSAPEIGLVGKCIYVFILYTLTNSVCGTFASCGDAVYLKRAVRRENNRVVLTSFTGAIVMFFSIIAGIVLPQLLATLGTTKAGWTRMSLLFGIPLIIIGSLRMITVKEVAVTDIEEAKNTPKVPFKKVIGAIAKNKLVFLLSGMCILYQVVQVACGFNYYFKWVMGDLGLASILGLASMIIPIALAFVPAITKRLGTSKLLIVGMLVNLIGCGIRMILPNNMLFLVIAQVLTMAGMLPIASLGSLYQLECMEYGQKKSGINIDGVTGAFQGFSLKVGSAVGSALTGFLMGASGYLSEVNVTVQPETALKMIQFMFVTLPFILGVVSLVLALMYSKVRANSLEE